VWSETLRRHASVDITADTPTAGSVTHSHEGSPHHADIALPAACVSTGTNDANVRRQQRPPRRRHRRGNSSIDFDYVYSTKQNYGLAMGAEGADAQQQLAKHKQPKRRHSRRVSKKLRLYLEFADANGQELWKAVQRSELHQKYLVVEYVEQTQPTLSALVTMATCFNARATAHFHNADDGKVDAYDEVCKLNEEKMLALYDEHLAAAAEAQASSALPSASDIVARGMSLEEAGAALQMLGCKAVRVRHTFSMSLGEFGRLLRETLRAGSHDADRVVLVNYDLAKLGQGLALGHMGVVAGYHAKDDMALLLDPSWKMGKCWVPLRLLYDAMNSIDDVVGKYRGCVVAEGLPLLL